MAKQKFTKEQIDKFEKKAEEFNSEEELLITLNAIRVRDKQVFIMQYEGLGGTKDPVTGAYFLDDHAYTLYANFIEEIKKRDKKRNYARKMEVEHLAALAEQVEEVKGIDGF